MNPHVARLRDKHPVMVRDVRESDALAIRDLFARMSPLSIRHRYFVAKRELAPSDLAWLGRLDDGRS